MVESAFQSATPSRLPAGGSEQGFGGRRDEGGQASHAHLELPAHGHEHTPCLGPCRRRNLDLGFVPGAGGQDVRGILDGAASGAIELVYLLGADDIDMAPLKNAFVVYQGHHGDAGAANADVVLPGAAYTEKPGTYVNTEGRVQRGYRAAFPPGEAREDWAIIRALSDRLGKSLAYNNLEQLRERLVAVAPTFTDIDVRPASPWAEFGTSGDMDAQPFVPAITDFYLTNSVSRASKTMHACADSYAASAQPGTGTNG